MMAKKERTASLYLSETGSQMLCITDENSLWVHRLKGYWVLFTSGIEI